MDSTIYLLSVWIITKLLPCINKTKIFISVTKLRKIRFHKINFGKNLYLWAKVLLQIQLEHILIHEEKLKILIFKIKIKFKFSLFQRSFEFMSVHVVELLHLKILQKRYNLSISADFNFVTIQFTGCYDYIC